MKISILMASYNANEEYLSECIKSIQRQTFKDYEVVIVDDHSKIPVKDLLKKNNIIDEKIRVVRLNVNSGLPTALNEGIKYCKGQYIARMDDDDIMDNQRLEKQLKYLESHSEYVGCWSNINRISRDGSVVENVICKLEPKKYLKQLVSRGNIFCHSSLFIEKCIMLEIEGYDENLKYAQDSELYIRILEKYDMGMIDDVLVLFRVNDYRNSYYRECLSLTYSFFGSLLFYIRNPKSIRNFIWFFER